MMVVAADKLPQLGGQVSENCPSFKRPPCYEECRHLNDTLTDYYNFENYLDSPRHTALTESILNIQDEFLRQVCEYEPDICVVGSWFGFPCVQCGEAINPKFSVCPSIEFECEGSTYFTNDPCKSLCGDICLDRCTIVEFDFQSSPEAIALYELIINAIASFDNERANLQGVEDFAQLIWGIDAKVVYFNDLTFYIWIGRNPTALEISILSIINNAFPLPIGTSINLVSQ